jgi:hypothetical protein
MSNKKNGGIIPPINDIRTAMVPIGCGKCMECRKQKAREWSVRLQEEIKNEKLQSTFVTLTFNDESLEQLRRNKEEGEAGKEFQQLDPYEQDNEIATLAVRRFLERWRKENKTSIKHWLVTELGTTSTERIHLHGIIWSRDKEKINKHWKYGHTWIGEYVNNQTINYIVKYVNKTDQKHKEYKSKILCSAGIGRKYIERPDAKINKYNGNKTNETYTTREGIKLSLPIYYRNNLYNEEEKEKLWLIKLDKEERYVLGQKIKISGVEGEKQYYAALQNAQQKNKRLGYGDDKINLSRKQYENERRRLKIVEQRNKQK